MKFVVDWLTGRTSSKAGGTATGRAHPSSTQAYPLMWSRLALPFFAPPHTPMSWRRIALVVGESNKGNDLKPWSNMHGEETCTERSPGTFYAEPLRVLILPGSQATFLAERQMT